MQTILVSGGTGFLGRALCRRLTTDGHHVIALGRADGDIADPATLAACPVVDHVVHLAGRTFVPDSWRAPTEFHRTNVLGTSQVLEYCRRVGAGLTSVSAYLYGVPTSLPVSESHPLRPNNPYALSKVLAEQVCAFDAERHGQAVTILRPFNVYGPGQDRRFLIPQVMADVYRGRAIEVQDLAPRRDYLYVDDWVDAVVATLGPAPGLRILNLGAGQSHSVQEVVSAIQRVAGTTLPVTSRNAPRRDELDDVCADISRAQAVLGWRPRVSFEEGLARMWAHMEREPS